MSAISGQILDAVNILVADAIKNAKLDRTIEAQIVSCEDINIGKYLCNYHNVIIQAYSAHRQILYHKDDLVSILVPQSDMSKKKIIIYGSRYSDEDDKIILNGQTGAATFNNLNISNLLTTTAITSTNDNINVRKHILLDNSQAIRSYLYESSDTASILCINTNNDIQIGGTLFDAGNMSFNIRNTNSTNHEFQFNIRDNNGTATKVLAINKDNLKIDIPITSNNNQVQINKFILLKNNTGIRSYLNDNSTKQTIIGLSSNNNIYLGGTDWDGGNTDLYVKNSTTNDNHLIRLLINGNEKFSVGKNGIKISAPITSDNSINIKVPIILDNNQFIRGYLSNPSDTIASLIGVSSNNIQIGGTGYNKGHMHFFVNNDTNANPATDYKFRFYLDQTSLLEINKDGTKFNNNITLKHDVLIQGTTKTTANYTTATIHTLIGLTDNNSGSKQVLYIGPTNFGPVYIRSGTQIIFQIAGNNKCYIDGNGWHNNAPSTINYTVT